jgi:hypothetical protein
MMKLNFLAPFSLFALASCSFLQPVSLYEEVTEKDALADFQFKEIFMDSQSSVVNGLKKQVCKTITFPSEGSVIGDDHIHLQWNKTSECRYVGMGFAWGNYQGKDLTSIVDIAAIEFMIRMEQGSSTKLPLFFSMNDYGNKACRSKINYLDIEGGVIDTNWTRVRIPLQTFNYKAKGVNLTNIKDFRIELQQSGDVHLDAIRIVRHEHRYPASPGPKASGYLASLPMKLGVGQNHWWGINPTYSDDFRFMLGGLASAESNTHGAQEAVQVDYVKVKGKPWNDFGFAFHEWARVDLSNDYRTAALHFKMRSSGIPKLQVSLVSYTGPQRLVQTVLKPEHIKAGEDGFTEAYIPIKSFKNFEKVNWSAMQEVRFKVLQNAQFEIGDFELIEFRGNPEKPTQWNGI